MTVDGRILTEFNLLFAIGFGALSATMLERGGRYTRSWLNNQAQDVLAPGPPWEPPQDWDWITDIVAGFKASNPDTKVGLYTGSGIFSRSYEPAYTFINDTTDLLHEPDGDPLIFFTGDINHRWANYAQGARRTSVAAQYVDFCETEGFDGIFWDSYDPAFYGALISSLWFSFPGGLLEGPYHTTAAWEEILAIWGPQVQAALEATGRRLLLNGLGYDSSSSFLGTFQTNTVLYGSGVIFEHGHQAYKNPTKFGQTVDMVRRAVALGGEVFLWFQPELFKVTDPDGSGGSTVVYTVGTDLMWFYLALYLLCEADDKTSFGYHPYVVYQGLDPSNAPYIHWEDAWDLEFGRPTGHRVDGGTMRLWWRRFSRGIAVCNPTSSELTFREPGAYRVRHPASGQAVDIGPEASSWYRMAPYTGTFLFDRRAA